MTFLYNSIRGLFLTAIAGIVMVIINKEIADIIFRIYIAFMVLTGMSLILLVMKENKPNSTSYTQSTPYNAQNRHNYRERTHARDKVSEIVNDNSYTNRINTDDKGSQNRKQCFISFHDIFMPPSMTLIVKRIISRAKRWNNQMQIKPNGEGWLMVTPLASLLTFPHYLVRAAINTAEVAKTFASADESPVMSIFMLTLLSWLVKWLPTRLLIRPEPSAR